MKKLIGFQLERAEHQIPDDLHSFEVLTFTGLENYLNLHPFVLKDFHITPIFEGDVEEPTMID